MDIQALKLDLVEKIIQTEETSLLMEISRLFQSKVKSDWWDKLPVEVQDSIKEGLADINEGNLFSHEAIIAEAKQKYGF